MSKWDEYEAFSTIAKSHGGANAYLDFLENIAKEEGRDEGRSEGSIIGALVVLGMVGVISGGVWAFKKSEEYRAKRKKEKLLAATVRQELLNCVQKYETQESREIANVEFQIESEEVDG